MMYRHLHFTFAPPSQDAADVMSALMAEAGAEAFVETDDGIVAYVQETLFDEQAVRSAIEAFPMPCRVEWRVAEAPDEDWNAQWEATRYEPIAVGEAVVIHGPHHSVAPGPALDIVIDPRQAFGSGAHETTRMIVAWLAEQQLKGKHIIDAGCGTGVLSIVCAKLGAASVLAYDVDEWSVSNTEHNKRLNDVSCITTKVGNAAVISDAVGYDLVLANINRNILVADMPRFAKALSNGGVLCISGFLAEDVELLQGAARECGLTLDETRADGDWRMMTFTHGHEAN